MKNYAKIWLGVIVIVLSLLPLGCGATYVGVGVGYGGYGPAPWGGYPGGGTTVVITGRPPIAY